MASTLVTATWLVGQIKAGNTNLRIFDTTVTIKGLGDEDFKSVHIEGAQFLNIFTHATPTKEIPVNLPDPERFQEYLRSLGINVSSHVILYENTDLHAFAGPRGWWLLRAYGINNVSYLDGGLKSWQKEGFPVTDKITNYEDGDVKVTVDRHLMASYDDVIKPSDLQYVDTRLSENFTGEQPDPLQLLQAFLSPLEVKLEHLNIQRGHMPGAVNVPYPSMFQEDMVTFKPKEELIQLFQNQGVKMDGRLRGSCYLGLTACSFALAASVCGLQDVSIYYGSWIQYGQRAPADRVEKTSTAGKDQSSQTAKM